MVAPSHASFLLLSLAAPQDVLVVDDSSGPGFDFTTIGDAVDAAQDGDVVLVRAGSYTGTATISGKSLVVTADTDAVVDFTGALAVVGLAEQQTVLLSGIRAQPDASGLPALTVRDNDGSVFVDRWILEADPSMPAAKVVDLQNSSVVVFNRLSVKGGAYPGPSGTGVEAWASHMYMYDSQIMGGQHYPSDDPGMPGGIGLDFSAASLFDMGSVVQGGQGTDAGTALECTGVSGDGGPGLVLSGSGKLYSTELVGGLAGELAGAGTCTEGEPGEPIVVAGGSSSWWSWPIPQFTVSSPARVGESASVTLSGQPNDLAWIGFSTAVQAQSVTGVVGRLIVGAPLLLQVGSLGPTGQLSFDVPAFVPPGAEGQTYYAQAILVDTGGDATFSQPAPLVTLDAAL